MKKAILLILCTCLTLMLQAQVSKIINVTAGGLSSALTDEEKSTITNLTVTGTIDARDFKAMRDNMPLLAEVDLSGTTVDAYNCTDGSYFCAYEYPANAIPVYAFYDQSINIGKWRLTSVILPSSVTSIGSNAFLKCGLTSVSLPSNLNSIGNSAFSGNSNLPSINIPLSVKTIGSGAFSGCASLTSIILPPSLASIEASTFMQTGLTSITIPESITSIGESAFYQCNELASISFDPSSKLKSIGSQAFGFCSKLTTFDISSNVVSFGVNPFWGSVTTINVADDNPNFSSSNGVLYDKDQTLLIYCPASRTGNFEIPSTVHSIDVNAFWGCTGLNSITIPNSVTDIKNGAFVRCTGLTSLTIPSSVTLIESMAFDECSILTSIYSKRGVPVDLSTTNFVFEGINKSACTLYVPIGAKTAYMEANQWKDFTNIVETLEVSAGGLSTALTAEQLATTTKLTLAGTIDARDFKTMRDKMPALAVVDLSGVTIVTYTGTEGTAGTTSVIYFENEIPQRAFTTMSNIGKTTLTSIIFPPSITAIGSHSFWNCYNLSSVIIPSGVTKIGRTAFNNCIKLNTVTFQSPSSLKEIDIWAFGYCKALNTLNIPSSVNIIGEVAFSVSKISITVDPDNPNFSSIDGALFNKNKSTIIYCPSTKSGIYAIPSTVTTIGVDAFYTCSGLTSITIPSGLTTLEHWAFEECTGLTSISIPSSVSFIGKSAFYNCSGLTSIYAHPYTPVNLSNINGDGIPLNVFYGVNKTICKLYVPYGSSGLYANADEWKDFTNIIELPGFKLSATSAKIDAAQGSTVKVEIASDVNWTASSDQTWLTTSPATNMGNGTLTLTATANPTNTIRTAKVTVSATGVESQTIFVVQAYTIQSLVTKIFDFESSTSGKFPMTSLLESDEYLFGSTSQGGTFDLGTLFKIKKDGTGYTKLFEFNGSETGKYTIGQLTLIGNTLYGTTIGDDYFSPANGVLNYGSIFKINTDGSGFVKLHEFDKTNGMNPNGSLVLYKESLYGITNRGGIENHGVIFKINPDGTGFIKISDNTDIGTGEDPYNGITIANDVIYGVSTVDYGGVFKVNIDGTGLAKIFEMNRESGDFSYCKPLLINDELYITTSEGGTNGVGTIFKIKTDGTGFTVLHNFTGIDEDTESSGFRNNSLAYVNGMLYGTACGDGINNHGYLYKLKTDGTNFTKLSDFNGEYGSLPYLDNLISDTSKIFGITTMGGNTDEGIVYSFTINHPTVANAGGNQTVNQGAIVTLDGTASRDADGDVLSYTWTSPVGIVLNSGSTATATFTAPNVLTDTPYTFTLTVSDGTATSTDQVVVTVKNKDEVIHFVPVWTGKGVDHMNINVYSAKADGQDLEAGDEIGIFDGTKCVGVGQLQQTISETQTLNIAVSRDEGTGNGYISGNAITYKFYDKNKTQEVSNVTPSYSSEDTNWITDGRYAIGGTSFVSLNGATTATQTISLSAGWNIISANVKPLGTDMKAIFQPLIDAGTLKKVMDEAGKTLENFGAFGGWKNNIGNLTASKGYKVNVLSPSTLSLEGTPVLLPFDIALNTGWNIISFPATTASNAMAIFQSLIDAGKLKKVMDETGKTLENFGAFGGWKNNIGSLTAGKGYKVNVTGSCTLTITEGGTKAATIVPEVLASTHFKPVYTGNGTDHMTINLVELESSGIESGDELGVFDGSICVGSAKVGADQERGDYLSIPVSASDGINTDLGNGFTEGHRVTMKLYRGGKEQEANLEILSSSQPVFAKGESMFVRVKAAQTTSIDPLAQSEEMSVKCYPNPFSEQVTIEIQLPIPGDLKVEVFDITGKIIRKLYKGKAENKTILIWDRKSDNGTKMTTGSYYVKANQKSKKLIIRIN